jgi:GNAT superfamily N-acetyltransferase
VSTGPPPDRARDAAAGAAEVRAVGYDHPDAVLLIAEVQDEYVTRYGDADETPMDPGEFEPPEGLFLVAYLQDEPAGCGAIRRHGDDVAEIKRMYVRAVHRGRGLARLLLAELEAAALRAGRRRIVLETGARQPEAIGLYTSAGYRPIPSFGFYRHSPLNRCFGKDLGTG